MHVSVFIHRRVTTGLAVTLGRLFLQLHGWLADATSTKRNNLGIASATSTKGLAVLRSEFGSPKINPNLFNNRATVGCKR
jgi:hypothetical protein